MSSPTGQLVFVYGTLKRGGSNHAFLRSQTFCAEARTIPGFRLINLGDYPGMIADSNDREGVAGEAWAVDEACLASIDQLEGTAEGLYRRERVPLLPPFADRDVQTYLYALSPGGKTSITGGLWPEPAPRHGR